MKKQDYYKESGCANSVKGWVMIFILFALLFFVFGCGNPYPENKKDAITKGIDTVRTDGSIVPIKERDETPIFHVKIKSYGDGVCYFAIWFTNDNFITQQNIMQVIDLSEISGGG